MVRNQRVWTLRGINSYAFFRACDSWNYTVFVDVTKFVDWIYEHAKNFKTNCGERKITIPGPLIMNGNLTYHGEHPWLVSLQAKMVDGTFMHQCGASIINEWSLVTGKSLQKMPENC